MLLDTCYDLLYITRYCLLASAVCSLPEILLWTPLLACYCAVVLLENALTESFVVVLLLVLATCPPVTSTIRTPESSLDYQPLVLCRTVVLLSSIQVNLIQSQCLHINRRQTHVELVPAWRISSAPWQWVLHMKAARIFEKDLTMFLIYSYCFTASTGGHANLTSRANRKSERRSAVRSQDLLVRVANPSESSSVWLAARPTPPSG